MAGLRFTDLQSRPMAFLDFTSLTLDEFQQLVPPFETAFQCHMAAWRMDGKPRTARRFTVDQNCPLLTPEARLLFILAYLKTYALQVVHGRLFGMVQSKAHQWIHPGSRASGCVRRFLLRQRSSLYHHSDIRYDDTSRKTYRRGALWWLRCSRLVPWPTCRWCWGWYASSTWLRSSIPSALHIRLISFRVAVAWRPCSWQFSMVIMPSIR
jgi:Helix-turn-helix of DDE superfamily endonuclease